MFCIFYRTVCTEYAHSMQLQIESVNKNVVRFLKKFRFYIKIIGKFARYAVLGSNRSSIDKRIYN